jgi:peptidoglycan/LPS O-acetylase OafA/YrhL
MRRIVMTLRKLRILLSAVALVSAVALLLLFLGLNLISPSPETYWQVRLLACFGMVDLIVLVWLVRDAQSRVE